MKRVASERGFTLLEVLVALAIAAITLTAAMRAGGSLAANAAELRARTYAQWSAENRLAQIRVSGEFPPLGIRSWNCSQGPIQLRCREEILATPNAAFRRVELYVEQLPDGHRLARLTGFAIELTQ